MKSGWGQSKSHLCQYRTTAQMAFWQAIGAGPTAYLDERVRAAMSSFWKLGDISQGLEKLEADLNSGEWDRRYSDLLNLKELDCGYRLIETK